LEDIAADTGLVFRECSKKRELLPVEGLFKGVAATEKERVVVTSGFGSAFATAVK
jgi:hypothetical protein